MHTTIRNLPYMTDLKKIAKSKVVHFAHICAYGVETGSVVSSRRVYRDLYTPLQFNFCRTKFMS